MNNEIFDYKRVAQGYKNRPFLHAQVIEKFQKEMNFNQFERGLDIGCGAGLSTKALKMICRTVTGTDSSEEMIAVAEELCGNDSAYRFAVCKAEDIDTLNKQFDIVSAAGVIQWVERSLFLNNLKKVLKKDGFLVIYDFGISDIMKDNTLYSAWWNDLYIKEFPKPSRNESVWTNDDLQKEGFTLLKQSSLEMEYEFDLRSFIEFMMIQSNVNVRIEGEGRKQDEVRAWFEDSLAEIFENDKKTLLFTGYIWYIKML